MKRLLTGTALLAASIASASAQSDTSCLTTPNHIIAMSENDDIGTSFAVYPNTGAADAESLRLRPCNG